MGGAEAVARVPLRHGRWNADGVLGEIIGAAGRASDLSGHARVSTHNQATTLQLVVLKTARWAMAWSKSSPQTPSVAARSCAFNLDGMAPFACVSCCLAESNALMNAAGRAALVLSPGGGRMCVTTLLLPTLVAASIHDGMISVPERIRRCHGGEGLGLAE